MTQKIFQADLEALKNYLCELVRPHISEQAESWLNQQSGKLQNDTTNKTLYLSFSSAPRFVGKIPINFTADLLAKANMIRAGFNPSGWTTDRAIRTYFLLFIPVARQENYIKTIETLFNSADIDEQVALYGALPLLPFPASLSRRAKEGIRTNMIPVFESIVLNNPYPAEYLEENAWNQMVLKAVFTERPLYKIYNADQRVNPHLAKMLSDFAHERWAAHRMVTPELWRFVAPYLDDFYLTDIKKILHEGTAFEKEAGALACSKSDYPAAKSLLQQYPELKDKAGKDDFSWNKLGKDYYAVQ